jgi:diguanylate cyclase (GGDEF)-like protein
MRISLADLKKMDLFQNIELDSIPEALTGSQRIIVEEGQLVLSPEMENNTLYLVLSGSLAVHLENPESKESEPIRHIYSGSCVGELSLIRDINPSAWIVAIEKTEMVAIDHEIFWKMITMDGLISKNLLSIVACRILDNTEIILKGRHRIQELEQVSMMDSLTQVFNRRWFDGALAAQMNRFRRKMEPFTLFMVDVDLFKNYNDTQGHLAGDNALTCLAGVLSESIRPSDFVARYGGEEFAVILPDTLEKDAAVVASRLLQAVESAPIHDRNNERLPSVTISIGMAQVRPNDTGKNLINAADEALYRAKENGRNCFCKAIK